MGGEQAFTVPDWLAGLEAVRGGGAPEVAPAPASSDPPSSGVAAGEIRHCTIVAFEIQGLDAARQSLTADEARYVEAVALQVLLDTVSRHDGILDPGATEPWNGEAIAYFGAHDVDERISDKAVHSALVYYDKLTRVNQVLARKALTLACRAGAYYAESTVERTSGTAIPKVVGRPVDCARELKKNAEPAAVLVTQRMAAFLGDIFNYGGSQDIYFEPLDATLTIVPVMGINPQSADPWIHRRGRLVTPFYGRSDELDLLMDSYENARSGSGLPVLWMRGAHGIGKSRTLNEFRSRLLALSARPVVLSAAIPDYPFTTLDLLQMLFVHAYVYLRPEFLAPLQDEHLPLEQKLDAYIAAMKSFHRGLNAPPLVVMIDDLDRAEDDTVQFLGRLIPEVQPAQHLACYFTAGRLHPVPPALKATTTVDLEALPESIVVQMLDYLCRHWHLPYSLVEDLLEKCEGNPLYLEDLFYFRVEGGFLVRDKSGNWVWAHSPGTFSAPAHLNDLLLSELNLLAPDGRRLLQWCSVLSQPFRFATIEVIASQFLPQISSADLAATLRALADQGFLRLFIRRSDKSIETGRFASDLLRQALERTVLKTNKQLLVETAGPST